MSSLDRVKAMGVVMGHVGIADHVDFFFQRVDEIGDVGVGRAVGFGRVLSGLEQERVLQRQGVGWGKGWIQRVKMGRRS